MSCYIHAFRNSDLFCSSYKEKKYNELDGIQVDLRALLDLQLIQSLTALPEEIDDKLIKKN